MRRWALVVLRSATSHACQLKQYLPAAGWQPKFVGGRYSISLKLWSNPGNKHETSEHTSMGDCWPDVDVNFPNYLKQSCSTIEWQPGARNGLRS